MDQIAVVGEKVLTVLTTVAYWTTAIAGTGQLINCIARKDYQNALKQALGYGVAFASIFVLIWMLDLIKGVFA